MSTNNRSELAALLALLLVVGVALILLVGGVEGGMEGVDASEGTTAVTASEAGADLSALTSDGAEAERTPAGATAEPEAPGDVEHEIVSTDLWLAGTLVVQEPDGRMTGDADGRVQFSAWESTATMAMPVTVKVERGRWRLRVDRDAGGGLWLAGTRQSLVAKRGSSGGPDSVMLTVSGAIADSERGPSVLESVAGEVLNPQSVSLDRGSDDVAIVLRRLAGITLSVLDGDTDSHLDGIRVLRMDYGTRKEFLHPGNHYPKTLRADATSPFRVEPKSEREVRDTLLVGRDGYAWSKVALDFKVEGARVVRLRRGASIVVKLPELQREGLELRLRRAGKRALATSSYLVDESEVRWDGLPADRYRVSLELGEVLGDPAVFAEAMVDLRPGVTERIELDVEWAKDPGVARVAGTLTIPSAWGTQPLGTFYAVGPGSGAAKDVRLRRHQTEALPGADGVYAFDVGEIPVGGWVFALDAPDVQFAFELGPEGRTDLRFDVPPPVDLRVRVVDARTGKLTPVGEIYCSRIHPEETERSQFMTIKAGEVEGRFELRVPEGPAQLMVVSGAYVPLTKTLEVIEGLEVTLEIRPAASAFVRLLDGETRVPWPDGGAVNVRALTGAGKLMSSSAVDGGYLLTFSEPGRYLIDVPAASGFKPRDPVSFEVREGDRSSLDIYLLRE